MQACVLIRELPQYRRSAFCEGLTNAGYNVTNKAEPAPGNVLVMWNRYGMYERAARSYEDAGGTVLIAENGYLGRDWRDGHWYALAKSFHNGGGWWKKGDEKRWESWNVNWPGWRRDGSDVVVLATRHIGPEGVREPLGWAERTAKELQETTHRKVRIRRHPGENTPAISLEDDIKGAWCVVTWGSGAALKAILQGIPVFHGYPKWIGAAAAAPMDRPIEHVYLGSPLPMFNHLSWAMWNTEELSTGEPFKWLLQ